VLHRRPVPAVRNAADRRRRDQGPARHRQTGHSRRAARPRGPRKHRAAPGRPIAGEAAVTPGPWGDVVVPPAESDRSSPLAIGRQYVAERANQLG
jgi:hypothetical protein